MPDELKTSALGAVRELKEITAETDTRDYLRAAAKQAHKQYDDYELIVDIDAHLQEARFWHEILGFMENDVLKQTAEGQLAGLGLLQRARIHLLFLDHAHFEGGGTAEDVLGLGRVLHARQLHHDAVDALLLDHRLGHAEFVDAVVQRGDVLLDRRLLHATRRFGLQRARQLDVGAIGGLGPLQVAQLVLEQLPRGHRNAFQRLEPQLLGIGKLRSAPDSAATASIAFLRPRR